MSSSDPLQLGYCFTTGHLDVMRRSNQSNPVDRIPQRASLKVKPHPTSRPPQHPIALLLPVC